MSKRLFASVFLVLLGVLFACGSEGRKLDESTTPPDDTGSSGDLNSSGSLGGSKPVTKIAIDPPTAAITTESGVPTSQSFKIIATYADATTQEITTGAAWTATNLQVGNVTNGLYTTTGNLGGVITINATFQGQKANATLTVKLHIVENSSSISPAIQTALKGATTKDAAVQWAYPYDGTVFPRGIAGPTMMWNNGAAADSYYVHVTSATFDLEAFTTVPPPSRYAFQAATWTKFVESTKGAADLTVARHNGTAATIATQQKWSIAGASMRGTIYYWANNAGRVMRIKPGAAAPDDFSVGTFGALPASACTMTCHTVSADGSTLVSGGDTLGGSFDLLKNKPIYDTGGAAGSAQKRLWSNPAVSPNGQYLIQNSSPLPGPPGAQSGLFQTNGGAKVAASGLDGIAMGMPAFAPDGTKIAYVGIGGANADALSVMDFDMKTAKAAGVKSLVSKGAGLGIAWPSVTPDAKWIIYHRGPLDTRDGLSDLFLANSTTPNQEIRLANLNGDTYPFAAGVRDRSYNYEPTFAPVPSGGYFWVVFTSRRTYGNKLLGAKDAVKLLWVAAIDLNPTPGKDPSHPPFLLPGQDEGSLNMRGFWALDPCKGDGQGCATGTECCGGFCDGKGPAGSLVCASSGTCAQDGDHCEKTEDCCNAPAGTTCINKVCSEPGPK